MLLKLAKAGAAKIGAKVMIILILVVALLMLVFGAFMGEKEDSGRRVWRCNERRTGKRGAYYVQS